MRSISFTHLLRVLTAVGVAYEGWRYGDGFHTLAGGAYLLTSCSLWYFDRRRWLGEGSGRDVTALFACLTLLGDLLFCGVVCLMAVSSDRHFFVLFIIPIVAAADFVTVIRWRGAWLVMLAAALLMILEALQSGGRRLDQYLAAAYHIFFVALVFDALARHRLLHFARYELHEDIVGVLGSHLRMRLDGGAWQILHGRNECRFPSALPLAETNDRWRGLVRFEAESLVHHFDVSRAVVREDDRPIGHVAQLWDLTAPVELAAVVAQLLGASTEAVLARRFVAGLGRMYRSRRVWLYQLGGGAEQGLKHVASLDGKPGAPPMTLPAQRTADMLGLQGAGDWSQFWCHDQSHHHVVRPLVNWLDCESALWSVVAVESTPWGIVVVELPAGYQPAALDVQLLWDAVDAFSRSLVALRARTRTDLVDDYWAALHELETRADGLSEGRWLELLSRLMPRMEVALYRMEAGELARQGQSTAPGTFLPDRIPAAVAEGLLAVAAAQPDANLSADARSRFTVPILASGQRWGLLAAASAEPSAIGARQKRWLRQAAHSVAVVADRAEADLPRFLLAAACRASRAPDQELRRRLSMAAFTSHHGLGFTRVCLLSRDPLADTFVPVASCGPETDEEARGLWARIDSIGPAEVLEWAAHQEQQHFDRPLCVALDEVAIGSSGTLVERLLQGRGAVQPEPTEAAALGPFDQCDRTVVLPGWSGGQLQGLVVADTAFQVKAPTAGQISLLESFCREVDLFEDVPAPASAGEGTSPPQASPAKRPARTSPSS